MKLNIGFFLSLVILSTGCTSSKSTIKNIDETAKKPKIVKNQFLINEYANDAKYGYNKDYPINIGIANLNSEKYFIDVFFNALLGENSEKFTYKKIDTCCPFPSKNNNMGVGLLHKYEITFTNGDIKELYFNIYEKGKIVCPNGFKINTTLTK